MKSPLSDWTKAGLALTLLAPPLLAQALGGSTGPLLQRTWRTVALDWVLALTVLALVRYGERRPWRSIGLRRPQWRDVWVALGGFVVGALLFAVTGALAQVWGWQDTRPGIAALATLPWKLRGLIVLTAAFTEEVLFRGYPIERLEQITGSPWLAGGLTWAWFTVLHWPFWGAYGALQIGIWTAWVTWLYLRRRRLWTTILLHAFNDAYAFLLLPQWLS